MIACNDAALRDRYVAYIGREIQFMRRYPRLGLNLRPDLCSFILVAREYHILTYAEGDIFLRAVKAIVFDVRL